MGLQVEIGVVVNQMTERSCALLYFKVHPMERGCYLHHFCDKRALNEPETPVV